MEHTSSWLQSCCAGTSVILAIGIILLSLVIYGNKCRGSHVPLDPKGWAVLVTGCNSGFGNQMAFRLLDMGFTVFAACLFPDGEGARSLARYSSPGQVKVIKLDVTSDAEVAKAKEYVENNLPAKGLWGIVNNAGISAWGMSNWHTIAQYQRMLDVNLLGYIRTTLAFYQLIQRSKGRMVFLSSINAYIALGNGIYSMTKAGVEKFCDSLRFEMAPHGVKVCIIEPGNYAPATNIQPMRSTDDIWDSLPAEARETCSKEYVEKINQSVNKSLTKGNKKSSEVVDAIVDALTSESPRPRYLVASLAEKIIVYLSLWLPTSLFDKMLSKAFSR
ncbi:short-chain dehydrogenase/reductase family 9C member 7-like [Hyperolius riggenbachi]|uniref:short-chain dehydrogenase/reductase family 9C member 7-like n=1 Tax=Hyperolius riggenbachi TaxID=752182 RepID=UPI0035A35623